MTKKEKFAEILSLIENGSCNLSLGEAREVLLNEIALLEKKAATPRKPTATQIENESLKTEIVDYLTAENKPRTIKEMQEAVSSLTNLSNQRITHLLSALVDAHILVKEYVKKTPFFAINQ